MHRWSCVYFRAWCANATGVIGRLNGSHGCIVWRRLKIAWSKWRGTRVTIIIVVVGQIFVFRVESVNIMGKRVLRIGDGNKWLGAEILEQKISFKTMFQGPYQGASLVSLDASRMAVSTSQSVDGFRSDSVGGCLDIEYVEVALKRVTLTDSPPYVAQSCWDGGVGTVDIPLFCSTANISLLLCCKAIVMVTCQWERLIFHCSVPLPTLVSFCGAKLLWWWDGNNWYSIVLLYCKR